MDSKPNIVLVNAIQKRGKKEGHTRRKSSQKNMYIFTNQTILMQEEQKSYM